jgi:hypothetical protein
VGCATTYLLVLQRLRSVGARQDGTAGSTNRVCVLYLSSRYLHITLLCNSTREREAGLRCVAIPDGLKTRSVARSAFCCEASLNAMPVSDRNVPLLTSPSWLATRAFVPHKILREVSFRGKVNVTGSVTSASNAAYEWCDDRLRLVYMSMKGCSIATVYAINMNGR